VMGDRKHYCMTPRAVLLDPRSYIQADHSIVQCILFRCWLTR
jgi:hypothetical protein